MAIQPTLLRIRDILEEEEKRIWERDWNIEPGSVWSRAQRDIYNNYRRAVIAIADDVSVHGRTEAIFRTFEKMEEVFNQMDLQLNLPKCWIIGSNVETVMHPPIGIDLRRDGGKALGRPTFQRAWLDQRLELLGPPQRALGRFPVRIQYNLLRLVYNARFTYLAKVVDSDISCASLIRHDNRINNVLWEMGISQHVDELHTLRGLPFHFGGLDIQPMVGQRADKNRLITLARTSLYLSEHHASFLHAFNEYIRGNNMKVGASIGFDDGVGLSDFDETVTLEDIKTAAKRDVNRFDEAHVKQLFIEFSLSLEERDMLRVL